MYRSTATIDNQYNFGCKKFLANCTISNSQSEVGIVSKELNGYIVFMIDYLGFAITNDIDSSTVDTTLDFIIKN